MDNMEQTIIRIIQDYCFENSFIFDCDAFATYLAKSILPNIKNSSLDLPLFKQIATKRKSFFVGNDIQVVDFCKDLFQRINFESKFYVTRTIQDELMAFKRKMEDGNFRGFPKDKTSEDTLRCSLNLYLQHETFCEPRCSGGNCDIAIPKEKTVIETKLWRGEEYYNSGFPELYEYLEKRNYNKGYYVIFDYNKSDSKTIRENGEIYNLKYNKKDICVIFIKMNPIRPSKKYKETDV